MKLIEKIKSLSVGKKVYASLWAVSGFFMVLLIALFVGFSAGNIMDKKTPPKDGWTFTKLALDYHVKDKNGKEINIPNVKRDDVSVLQTHDDKTVDSKGNPVEIPESSRTFVDLKTAAKTQNFAQIYDIKQWKDNTPGGKEYAKKQFPDGTWKWTFSKPTPLFKLNEWKGELTAQSKKAQISVATMGLIFLLVLTSAIFSTVIVTVVEKKGKGGTK